MNSNNKKSSRTSMNCGTISKGITQVCQKTRRRREYETSEIFEVMMAGNSSKSMTGIKSQLSEA